MLILFRGHKAPSNHKGLVPLKKLTRHKKPASHRKHAEPEIGIIWLSAGIWDAELPLSLLIIMTE